MTWIPGESSWTSFKRGQTGWKVWALQLNLPVTADGNFGPVTEAAVKAVQKAAGLTVDGVAGPSTQQRICIVSSKDAETKYKIPVGLLKGIIEGESGNYLACVSGLTYDNGRDYGAYQDHQVNPSQAELARSFSVRELAEDTASKIRTQHDIYRKRGLSERRAWELAVLYHNWPYAADRLSRGLSIYSDGDDRPRQWIIDASAGRLSTATEWCQAYISSKTVYVTNWTP